jgi:major membrane immunogen (membrane-anchored lipoprotein)
VHRLATVCVLVAALLLSGCGSKDSGQKPIKLPETPDKAIELWLSAVNVGDYGAAAALMSNGIEMWKNNPGLVKSAIESATHAKRVLKYEPGKHTLNGEVASYNGRFHFSTDTHDWKTVNFEFVRQPQGWLIVSVR